MLGNATRLCEAKFGTLYVYEQGAFHPVALHNVPSAYAEARRQELSYRPPPDLPLGRIIATRRPVQIEDTKLTKSYVDGNPFVRAGVDAGGFRTVLAVPMLKKDELIGAIAIYRQDVRAVHRQADRSGYELRRSGGHRDREHPPAQGAAPAHRRSERGAGAADRDLGGAACHLEFARRAGAGVPGHAGECDTRLRGQVRHLVPARGRGISRGRDARGAAGLRCSPGCEPTGRSRTGNGRSAASCGPSRSVHIADVTADPAYHRARSHARRGVGPGRR